MLSAAELDEFARLQEWVSAHAAPLDRELRPVFKEGQVYSIYTPEYAPDAAAQLAQVLRDEKKR